MIHSDSKAVTLRCCCLSAPSKLGAAIGKFHQEKACNCICNSLGPSPQTRGPRCARYLRTGDLTVTNDLILIKNACSTPVNVFYLPPYYIILTIIYNVVLLDEVV